MKTYAMLFDEGPGYLLVKPLHHGTQGNVYLVISLADGKYYVRKRLDLPMDESNWSLYDKLPAKGVPRLAHITNYGKGTNQGDSCVFELCNGGNLDDFLDSITIESQKEKTTDIICWSLIESLMETLVHVHEQPHPVTHDDIFPANIFVHWPNQDALIPTFNLGDWDYSSTWLSRSVYFEGQQQSDIQSVHSILEAVKFVVEGITVSVRKGSAVWNFRRVWGDTQEILEYQPKKDFSPTVYVAEKLIPMAKRKIAELQSSDPIDLRCTKPDSLSGEFVSFSGENIDASLKSWQAVKDDNRKIRQPWRWVDVDELPDHLQSRGELWLVAPTAKDEDEFKMEN